MKTVAYIGAGLLILFGALMFYGSFANNQVYFPWLLGGFALIVV